MSEMVSDKDRFESLFVTIPETACWWWVGARSGGGYGSFRMKGKVVKAHRASYQIYVGDIPPGEGCHGTCVCHKCDNPLCVNPEHLFLGSNADNVADREAKGRGVLPDNRGSRNGMSKLTEQDVAKIRKAYGSHGLIAKQFGVSRPAVSVIKSGGRWKL